MTQKIVINAKHGGFGVSHEGMLRYFEIKGINVYPEQDTGGWKNWRYWLVPVSERVEVKEGEEWRKLSLEERVEHNRLYTEQTFYTGELERDDPALVQVVQELGEKSYGTYAELKVVSIPDGIEWDIHEYDGLEWIAQVHQTWS